MEESNQRYSDICRDIISQFTGGFNEAETKDKFATRGMIREVLSRSMLEKRYKSLWDDDNAPPAGQNALDVNHFVRNMEKMFHDLLAVLIYAKCLINAARIFAKKLVLGGRAEE
jgi:hypothetical protein